MSDWWDGSAERMGFLQESRGLFERTHISKLANIILYKCQKQKNWICISLQDGLPSYMVFHLKPWGKHMRAAEMVVGHVNTQ